MEFVKVFSASVAQLQVKAIFSCGLWAVAGLAVELESLRRLAPVKLIVIPEIVIPPERQVD